MLHRHACILLPKTLSVNGFLSFSRHDSQENPSSGSEPMLFPRDNRSIAEIFASEMSSHLQNMPETEQRELWEGWLKDYWQNRLDGVPARLTSGEAKLMLDWLTDSDCGISRSRQSGNLPIVPIAGFKSPILY